MTLYTPPHFAVRDRESAVALIGAHPFATLISAIDGVAPYITHLPLLLDGDALVGHMARVNGRWQAFAQAHTVAVFHGPHAYVSPRWYERPQTTVPTWNYATVHVGGRPRLLDADASRASLATLMQAFDPAFAVDGAVLDRLLPGIVAFRMPIDTLEASFKMSQNKSAADRAGVVAGLLATGAAESRATAHWMQTHD